MENKKNVLLAVLIVGVVSMTIAFAALSTNLNINGTASIPDVNWNIYFDSWALDTASTVTTNKGTQTNTAEYPTVAQLTKSLAPYVTKVEGLNITLKQPNDYAKYTFEIVNGGTIDGSLDNFTHTMTCESGKNCDFLEYTVECKDSNLNTVTTGYVLPHGQRVNCFLQLKFKDVDNLTMNEESVANKVQASIVNGVYTQEGVTATLNADWTWGQEKTSNQSQGGNSGGNEQQGGNEPTPSTSYETTFDGNYTYTSISEYETNEYGFVPVDFNNEWDVYLRNDGTKNETCNVFPTGTVCLTNSTNGRSSDLEDVSTYTANITTAAELQATGLKGYALSKAEEMLNKGASSCNVRSNYVRCYSPAGGSCSILDDGDVGCGVGDGSGCSVRTDGSADCS